MPRAHDISICLIGFENHKARPDLGHDSGFSLASRLRMLFYKVFNGKLGIRFLFTCARILAPGVTPRPFWLKTPIVSLKFDALFTALFSSTTGNGK